MLTREGVERLLEILPEGTTELMCHPGYADEELRQNRDAAAGIAADGAGNFDGRGDQKTCRHAGYSPDKL